jgi:fermentation-respiration switch protein FrsA (DUF1100 family)
VNEAVQPVAADKQSMPGSSGRRRIRWWRPIVAGLAVYAIWCVGLYFYQDALIFPAEFAPAPLKRPLQRPLSGQVVVNQIQTPAGHNESWFLPAPGASPGHPVPVVMFFHGNAEVIDYQDHVVRAYHRLGLSVLMPEYRGYGVAQGKPSQTAIREDNVRFYDDLVRRPDVDAKRVVFHGRSLGGGVACDLATKRKPAALVLECTFTSAAALANKYLAPSFLCKYPFRNDRVLRAATFPVLISHGTRDTIIPVSHGRALRDLVPGAVYREYDCGHNDWPGSPNEDDWWETTRRFLSDAGVIKGAEGRD